MCKTHVLTEITNPEFAALKADIEASPRLCGYYILGLVSIRDFRAQEISQETILETLIDHFDDDANETDPDFVPDHEWSGDFVGVRPCVRCSP